MRDHTQEAEAKRAPSKEVVTRTAPTSHYNFNTQLSSIQRDAPSRAPASRSAVRCSKSSHSTVSIGIPSGLVLWYCGTVVL